MSVIFPHVHSLNGKLWTQAKVPTRFGLRKEHAKHIEWVHGKSFSRECARQYPSESSDLQRHDMQRFEKQKSRLMNPSLCNPPNLSSRHPDPDFICLKRVCRGSKTDDNVLPLKYVQKTNNFVFYLVQFPWTCNRVCSSKLLNYEGDTGYTIAHKFLKMWKRNVDTILQNNVFVAWVVLRKSHLSPLSSHVKRKRYVHTDNEMYYILRKGLRKAPNNDIYVQKTSNISLSAEAVVGKENKVFKLRILHIIKPDIDTIVEERSVVLAVCQLIT